MINIQNVTYAYQKKKVLDDINLHIEKNERCALVGRNGAGKSTMIKTMLGLQPMQKGTISLGGIPNKKQGWKKIVSYLPEKFHLYPHLTGEENIRFFASLGPNKVDEKRIAEMLRMVSLFESQGEQITGYSKGMLQRLGLAVILYYDADIIILDEPTSGLDPMGRKEILQIIKSLENKTILMASHHLSEIEKICTHVAYLENGKVTKYPIEEFIRVQMKEEYA